MFDPVTGKLKPAGEVLCTPVPPEDQLVLVAARLHPKDLAAVRKIAEEKETNVSFLIRQAVQLWLGTITMEAAEECERCGWPLREPDHADCHAPAGKETT